MTEDQLDEYTAFVVAQCGLRMAQLARELSQHADGMRAEEALMNLATALEDAAGDNLIGDGQVH